MDSIQVPIRFIINKLCFYVVHDMAAYLLHKTKSNEIRPEYGMFTGITDARNY